MAIWRGMFVEAFGYPVSQAGLASLVTVVTLVSTPTHHVGSHPLPPLQRRLPGRVAGPRALGQRGPGRARQVCGGGSGARREGRGPRLSRRGRRHLQDGGGGGAARRAPPDVHGWGARAAELWNVGFVEGLGATNEPFVQGSNVPAPFLQGKPSCCQLLGRPAQPGRHYLSRAICM
jgi:hypothetical protein